MADNTLKRMSSYWIIGVIAVIAVMMAGIILWKPSANKDINSFQACKDAGGIILESYPEQCKINGKSFTNSTQSVADDANAYIGLAEQVALDRAESENKRARVVERDGETLPMTMDYVPGRLNLYVKDGNVYKVQIEGDDNQN